MTPCRPTPRPTGSSHTPTRYRLASIVQPDETLLLSPFDVRRDAVVLRADPGEQLRVFEGSGVGSTWRLSLRSPGQAVNLATLTDVDVIVYYYAQDDPALDRAVQLERRKLAGLRQLPLQRTRGFSLRESFPDELYHLHQPRPGVPADPWRARELALAVSGELFPPNEINRSLAGITLAGLAPDGGYHELIAAVSVGAQPIPAASFQGAADEPKIRTAPGGGIRPDVAWTITIQAADNPALAAAGRYQLDVNGRVAVDRSGQPIADAGGVVIFDAAKLANLADIWLIMNYRFQQGGEDGAPIALWSHFDSQAPASFVDGAFALQTAPWNLTDTRAGAPAWARAAGWFGQQAAGAAGLVAPSASPALADAHLLADVSVPATVGAQAGIVARRGLAGAHFNGYLARVTRLNSGDSEVGIDRLDGAATVNLARVTVAGLSRLQRFELGLRARGTRLDLFVDGALLLTATDATYASGGIACYAASAGPAFGNVLLSDLTGR